MTKPTIPDNENERQKALDSYQILDTESELAFDDLTQLAAKICNTPIALVTLIDNDRQWFKSKHGLDAKETSRDISFCGHAINYKSSIFEVKNTDEDTRFNDNPLTINSPNIKFYAGIPLINKDGYALGTLCVIDNKPRVLNEEQKNVLRALSRQVITQLEMRKLIIKTEKETAQYESILNNIGEIVFELNDKGEFEFVNNAMLEITGFSQEKIIGKHYSKLIHNKDRERVLTYYNNQLKSGLKNSSIQFRVLNKKTSEIWLFQETKLIFNKNNRVEKVIAFARDITIAKDAKFQLENKTKLLDSIISTMIESVIVFDINGKVILQNEAANKLIGSKINKLNNADKIKQYGFYQNDKVTLLEPSDLPSQLALSGKEVKGVELFVKNKINQAYISVNARPMFDYNNNINGAIIVATDITKQKNREFELLKGSDLLSQVQQFAKIGYWEVNFESNTVWWSEQTRKIHEVNKDYIPTLEDGINFYDQESKPIITKIVEDAIKSASDWDVKLKIITEKGNLKWVRSIGKAYQEGNNVNKLVGVFQDITKEKENEAKLLNKEKSVKELNIHLENQIQKRTKELIQSKERYQSLYDDAPDMMASIDPSTGLVMDCNLTTCKKLNYTKEEIIGKHIFEIYHLESHEEIVKTLDDFKSSGIITNAKLNLRKKNGDKIPVILSATAVKNKDGQILRTNSIWRDITKLEEAELALKQVNAELENRVERRTKQLKSLNKELEEFTYMTTHDLKSPISNIKGHLNIIEIELTEEKLIEHPVIQKSIHWIKDSIQQAEEKILSIIEMARLKDPASQIKQKINFRLLINEILNELKGPIEKNNSHIEIGTIEKNTFYFNRLNMKSVLTNIIGNALKYRKLNESVKITISLFETNNTIKIKIKDNGLGINLHKDGNKLFGLFERIHDHKEGSGIGLHLAKKIIENDGGTITVESEIDKGSTFVINIKKQE